VLKKFETLGLFPVPVIKIKFEDHYKYNFPEVEKKDQKPDSWMDSVQTTYPNIHDDDLVVSSMIRDSLKIDLKSSIVEVFEQLNLPTNIGYSNFWYNIYHDNQGQEKHDHLGSVGAPLPFWSGIYYNKNTSPTMFYRYDTIYKTHLFDGVEDSSIAPFWGSTFSPSVEDGDILLFPPYLVHSVESNLEHKDIMRMTFSFNLNLTPSFLK